MADEAIEKRDKKLERALRKLDVVDGWYTRFPLSLVKPRTMGSELRNALRAELDPLRLSGLLAFFAVSLLGLTDNYPLWFLLLPVPTLAFIAVDTVRGALVRKHGDVTSLTAYDTDGQADVDDGRLSVVVDSDGRKFEFDLFVETGARLLLRKHGALEILAVVNWDRVRKGRTRGAIALGFRVPTEDAEPSRSRAALPAAKIVPKPK